MLKGFRQFILKGNVVDLAVAVVIGAAFSSVVTSLTKDFINPLLALIGGQPDLSAYYATVGKSRFLYGDFFTTLISFLIDAAVIYFLVVLPLNKLISLSKSEKPADPSTKRCPQCLSDIPIEAKRCAFCIQPVPTLRPKRD